VQQADGGADGSLLASGLQLRHWVAKPGHQNGQDMDARIQAKPKYTQWFANLGGLSGPERDPTAIIGRPEIWLSVARCPMGLVWRPDFAGPAVQAEGPDDFRSGSQQGNDFCLPRLLCNFQQGESYRQMKAARPCATRIQVKNTCVEALLGLMGVAADDSVKAGGLWR
jgi:hypothetical protein